MVGLDLSGAARLLAAHQAVNETRLGPPEVGKASGAQALLPESKPARDRAGLVEDDQSGGDLRASSLGWPFLANSHPL